MTKTYQYQLILVKQEELLNELNRLGALGWKLFSIKEKGAQSFPIQGHPRVFAMMELLLIQECDNQRTKKPCTKQVSNAENPV